MALVSNQSLTPTRLDPNAVFTPSNYPDRRSVIAAFKRSVHMTLSSPEERSALFAALREFHSSLVVEELMDSLNDILDHPNRRVLYKYISPLVPSRLRGEYSSLVPHIPSFECKVIKVDRQEKSTLGFSIRGGKEFGCGIFISNVLPSSKAAQAGLKVGFEILRVNGLTLSESSHEEAVSIMKLKKSLVLAIKVIGLLPEMSAQNRILKWKTVEEPKKWQSSSRLNTEAPSIVQSTKRIQVNIGREESLGINVKITKSSSSGVLIVDVTPNSPAHNSGLRSGYEILEVNGKSLIGKTHDEAVRLLKSSNSLMLTIRVDSQRLRKQEEHGLNYGIPSIDFGPQDFDVDAEILSPYTEDDATFVLRPREDQLAQPKKKNIPKSASRDGRLAMLNIDTEQSKVLPRLASPAAEGWGPTVALPTLVGMQQELPQDLEESTDLLDTSVFSMRALSIVEGMHPQWDQQQLPTSPTSPSSPGAEEMPPSIAKIFPKLPRATVAGDERRELQYGESEEGNRAAAVPARAKESDTKIDLASYQFPVEDEDETDGPPPPPPPATPPPPSKPKKESPLLKRKPIATALKKSSPDGKQVQSTRRPKFSNAITVIPDFSSRPQESGANESATSVHPSNLSFSEEILKGRRVQFHTIPKDGPFKIAIRGGTDTPLGSQIILSRILEGGAAAKYGKLNVGDQVLVCDGVSLIDVTHDEAAQALKRAMDMESNSIDLVVAVNPEAGNRESTSSSGQGTNV